MGNNNTSFDKPRHITKGSNSYSLLYDADRARYKKVGPTDKITYYVGTLFERQIKSGNTQDVHFIYVGGMRIGTYTVRSSNLRETRYFHMDHLGSIDTVTDESGAVVERLSYAPFGVRRNFQDWSTTAGLIVAQETEQRGFTGHEHLDEVGLIHMNGRVYDQKLARFVSADPNVQFPDSTQGYNRYTYVNNNPLSLTDPSGFTSPGGADDNGAGDDPNVGDDPNANVEHVFDSDANPGLSRANWENFTPEEKELVSKYPGRYGVFGDLDSGFVFIAPGGEPSQDTDDVGDSGVTGPPTDNRNQIDALRL